MVSADLASARPAHSPADDGMTDKRELRRALGSFTTRITIMTARGPDGRIAGVTANSFCSVSLDPPLVLWCLAGSAPSRAVFTHASHFAVHILAEDQLALSDRFCRPSKNKFAGLDVAEGLAAARPYSVASSRCSNAVLSSATTPETTSS